MAFEYVLPREVSDRLHQLRQSLRHIAVLKGVGRFLIVETGLLISLMCMDLLVDLEPVTRIWLLTGMGVATLGFAGLWLVRPWFKHITDAELAALAEQKFPALGERLTSLIELGDPSVPEGQRGSALMRDLLEQQTVKQVSACDFDQAVSAKTALRGFWVGLSLTALLLLSLILFPSVSGTLLTRLLNPWGNFASVSRLLIEVPQGDRVVARGSDVGVAAAVTWRSGSDEPVPEPVTLHVVGPAGDDVRELRFDADSGAFTGTVPKAFDSFEFYVAADGSRSKRHRIEVVDPPTVLSAKLEITPPGYIGEPRRTVDGVTGEITVFEYSQLRFELTFNKPVQSAQIEWTTPSVVPGSSLDPRPAQDGDPEKRISPITNELIAVPQLPDLPLQLAADGLSATVEVPAEVQATFAFRLRDEHGLINEEPHRRLLITLDQPPLLEVAGSNRDQARPTDVYPFRVSAADDFGLDVLEVHVTSNTRMNEIRRVAAERLGGATVAEEFRIDLADLPLKAGERLTFQVRAADGRPQPGPNVIWSEPRHVLLNEQSLSPGANDVLARQNELQQELEAIRQDVKKSAQISEQLDQAAQQAADNDAPFSRNQELQQLTDAEAAVSRRLHELADRFETHPLFANLAPEAQRLAEQELKRLADELQVAGKFPPQDLAEQLHDNSGDLQQVDRELAAMQKRFDELAQLERDLLEVGRIAQRANQLADDAERLDARRQELAEGQKLEGDRDQDLHAARERLAQQQQQLQAEQADLMNALQDLLEQRPEILQAARDHQLNRLAELAEQARRLAEPQEALADALGQEAQQAADSNQATAERQRVLAEQAEQLAAQADQQMRRNPVEPLDPERAREILEELERGNLAAAERLASEAATDLERLARELQQSQPLPADPQAAARELAQRQEQLAADIAQAAQQPDAAANPERPNAEASASHEAISQMAARQAALQMAAAQLEVDRGSRDEQLAAVDQAAEALQQLVAAARNTPSDELPNSAQDAAARDSAQQALANAARQGREAAEALERLADAIQPEGEPSEPAPSRDPNQVAAAARQIAEQQEQLRQQTERLSDQNAIDAVARPNAEQLAEQQAELNQQAQQLPPDIAPLARAEALEQIAQAEQALEQNQAAQAAQAQRSAEQALESLARQAEARSNQPARSTAQNSEAGNTPQPQVPASPESQPQSSQQLASRAEQLAEQQRELQQEIAAARQQQNPGEAPQPSAGSQTTQERSSPSNTQQQPGNEPPQPGRSDRAPPAAQALLEQQAELTAEAAELALQAAEQSGAESAAAQAARGSAQSSEQAEARAQSGQFQPAAEAARDAAAAAQRSGEALAQNAPELANRAEQIAERQAEVARGLEQLASDAAARAQAQQSQQQRLAEQAAELEQGLRNLGQQLGAEPIGLSEPSQRAGQAGQSAAQGQQSMERAAQNIGQSNAGRASESGRRAAESLRRAAEQAGAAQPPEQTPMSPVPGEIANELTTAAQRLQQAQQQLEQALAQANSSAQSQSGQSPAGQSEQSAAAKSASGQASQSSNSSASSGQNRQSAGSQQASGQSSAGEGQGSQSQNASTAPGQRSGQNQQPGGGQSQGGQLSQSAQSLRDAAQNLTQAASQLQNGGQSQQSDGMSQNGQIGSSGLPSSGGTGGGGVIDPNAPDIDLQKKAMRNWGKLPGALRTEILQSAQRKANGDYAKLIKLYFEELAKAGEKSSGTAEK